MMIAIPCSSCSRSHQLEDLRLRRDVQRRRRLVGDDQIGVVDQRHGDHHPLAHAARELVRVVGKSLLGTWDADVLERLDRAARASLRVTSRCARTASSSCHPIDLTGLSDVIGSWKIIAISSPRNRLSFALLAPISSVPSKSRRALRHRVARLVQTHHGQARDALPRSRLTDDPERRAPLDRERDAVDRLHDAVVGAKLGAEVLDLEQRHQLSRILGSSTA